MIVLTDNVNIFCILGHLTRSLGHYIYFRLRYHHLFRSRTILPQILFSLPSKIYCKCCGWYMIKLDGQYKWIGAYELKVAPKQCTAMAEQCWCANPSNLASPHTINKAHLKQGLFLQCFWGLGFRALSFRSFSFRSFSFQGFSFRGLTFLGLTFLASS